MATVKFWDSDAGEWILMPTTLLAGSQTANRLPYWVTGSTLGSTSIVADSSASLNGVGSISMTGNITITGTVDGLDVSDLTRATGLIVADGVNSVTHRTVTAGNGVTITNGNGVSGNPTAAVRLAASASLEFSSGSLQLASDAAPVGQKYYGTSAAGAKGYHDLPSEDRPYLFVHTVNDTTSWTSATTYNFDYGNTAATSYGLPGIPYDCRLLGITYKANPQGTMTTQTFDINVIASREGSSGSTIKTQQFGVSGGSRHIETHTYDWSDNLAFSQGETVHVTATNHTGTWDGSNYMRRHAVTLTFGIDVADMPLLSS